MTRAQIWARVRAARASHGPRAQARDHIVTKFTNWKIFQKNPKFIVNLIDGDSRPDPIE